MLLMWNIQRNYFSFAKWVVTNKIAKKAGAREGDKVSQTGRDFIATDFKYIAVCSYIFISSITC